MKRDQKDADLKENKKASMRGIEDRAVEIGKKARFEVYTICPRHHQDMPGKIPISFLSLD